MNRAVLPPLLTLQLEMVFNASYCMYILTLFTLQISGQLWNSFHAFYTKGVSVSFKVETMLFTVFVFVHRVLKLAASLASNTSYSVCSS